MYTWHSLLHTHDELLAASVHVARFESKTGKQDILMVVICCLTALPGIRSKVRKLNPIWTLNKMGPQKNSSPEHGMSGLPEYSKGDGGRADGMDRRCDPFGGLPQSLIRHWWLLTLHLPPRQ